MDRTRLLADDRRAGGFAGSLEAGTAVLEVEVNHAGEAMATLQTTWRRDLHAPTSQWANVLHEGADAGEIQVVCQPPPWRGLVDVDTHVHSVTGCPLDVGGG